MDIPKRIFRIGYWLLIPDSGLLCLDFYFYDLLGSQTARVLESDTVAKAALSIGFSCLAHISAVCSRDGKSGGPTFKYKGIGK